MGLTQEAKKYLYNHYNGHGVLFIKTKYGEIEEIEFYRAKNGKLYTQYTATLLTEKINELSMTIKEE